MSAILKQSSKPRKIQQTIDVIPFPERFTDQSEFLEYLREGNHVQNRINGDIAYLRGDVLVTLEGYALPCKGYRNWDKLPEGYYSHPYKKYIKPAMATLGVIGIAIVGIIEYTSNYL